MITKLRNLFNRNKPVYGSRIFQQRSWLDRAVQEAQFKQSKYQVYNLR